MGNSIEKELFRAEQGDKEAQKDWGGGEKNLEQAVKWWTLSANQGDKQAIKALADISHPRMDPTDTKSSIPFYLYG